MGTCAVVAQSDAAQDLLAAFIVSLGIDTVRVWLKFPENASAIAGIVRSIRRWGNNK